MKTNPGGSGHGAAAPDSQRRVSIARERPRDAGVQQRISSSSMRKRSPFLKSQHLPGIQDRAGDVGAHPGSGFWAAVELPFSCC
jgi:hypothetical protein